MQRNLFKIFVLLFLLVFTIPAVAQTITTVAGNNSITTYTGDGGPATAAGLEMPSGVAVDTAGNLYIADYGHNVIRKVNTSGIISTFAGNGTAGNSGDGGPATAAELSDPQSVAIDAAGNVYFTQNDTSSLVRKVNTSGIISPFAGNGTTGYSGDGGLATAAQLNTPENVAFDAAGNAYITDQGNNAIRKVDVSGIITTYIAGLNHPWGIAIDAAGNIYFSDNSRVIRKIDFLTNSISIVAGTTPGCTGNGGPATSAQLLQPLGIAFDGGGNLYVADGNIYCTSVRKITMSSGIIDTFAGNGTGGYSGDGGPAAEAELYAPWAVAFDLSGNMYIADYDNKVIRKVNAACATPTGLIATGISGSGAFISWSAASGSLGYEYVVQTTGTAPTASGTAVTDTSFTATGLSAATTYYVYVRDSCGASGFSPWAATSFTTSALGVNELPGKKASIMAYPNPSNGNFIIKGNLPTTTEESVTVQIRDMLGRLADQYILPAPNGTINTALNTSLPGGVYLLHIISSTETIAMPFVINK